MAHGGLKQASSDRSLDATIRRLLAKPEGREWYEHVKDAVESAAEESGHPCSLERLEEEAMWTFRSQVARSLASKKSPPMWFAASVVVSVTASPAPCGTRRRIGSRSREVRASRARRRSARTASGGDDGSASEPALPSAPPSTARLDQRPWGMA